MSSKSTAHADAQVGGLVKKVQIASTLQQLVKWVQISLTTYNILNLLQYLLVRWVQIGPKPCKIINLVQQFYTWVHILLHLCSCIQQTLEKHIGFHYCNLFLS
jgi:hypothetical protein